MKSWREKLAEEKTPISKTIDKKFAGIPAGATMYISTPQEIDRYVRSIKRGKTKSPQDMRAELAAGGGAEYTCPVTTGIFLRIVAEAAFEELQAGKAVTRITPFWRVIEPDSNLAKKLSFGTDLIRERRSIEKIDR